MRAILYAALYAAIAAGWIAITLAAILPDKWQTAIRDFLISVPLYAAAFVYSVWIGIAAFLALAALLGLNRI